MKRMVGVRPARMSAPHIGHTPLVTVAIVNNTSDRALASTELQFLTLLLAAFEGTDLAVHFLTCPSIARTQVPCTRSGHPYRDASLLFGMRVDALIVTGMEPTAEDLRDEPVWDLLTRLVDWADHRAVPSIWSCLATHVAVLHLNQIERVRHQKKISDALDCRNIAGDHPLTQGLPGRWTFPHSRYYGVPESALRANGYQVLSCTENAGVDTFVRGGPAPFLFFQGHPEYDRDSLLKEYARDLRRYFSGERDEYPEAPASYFRHETALALAQLRLESLSHGRDERLFERALALTRTGVAPACWSDTATGIYANWLTACVLEAEPGQAFTRSLVEADTASRRSRTPLPLVSK